MPRNRPLRPFVLKKKLGVAREGKIPEATPQQGGEQFVFVSCGVLGKKKI